MLAVLARVVDRDHGVRRRHQQQHVEDQAEEQARHDQHEVEDRREQLAIEQQRQRRHEDGEDVDHNNRGLQKIAPGAIGAAHIGSAARRRQSAMPNRGTSRGTRRSPGKGRHIMPEWDDIERVWDLVEKIGVGMLTTRFAGGLRARPVEPRLDRDAGLIRIVTDVRGLKDDEIACAPEVNLAVTDTGDKAYLSIAGHAAVTRDRAAAVRNLAPLR